MQAIFIDRAIWCRHFSSENKNDVFMKSHILGS